MSGAVAAHRQLTDPDKRGKMSKDMEPLFLPKIDPPTSGDFSLPRLPALVLACKPLS